MTMSNRSGTPSTLPYWFAYCFAMSNSSRDGGPLSGGVGSGGVQSVDRAISVLEILARQGDARVTDVAAELDVHKSTAFRLLTALEERGLVEQDRDRGRYRLGFGVLRLAGAVSARMDVHRYGHPVCERLARELGETINIAVVQAHYAVNVDQVQGPAAISAHNWIGQLTPLHATSSGKVLLAHLDPVARTELLTVAGLPRLTKATITTTTKLERELTRARDLGYAITVEELEPGLHAMAAPIRNQYGHVIAAVSASGPAFRLTVARMTQLAPTLTAGADEISRHLGYLG
jgi:DNA-binding IclR family transcriptional regulator